MPVINDATVVSGSGYTTTGNGGRKLVMLDNGTLVSVVKTPTNWVLCKSINNGSTWSVIYTSGTVTSLQDISIATNGTLIYILYAFSNNDNYVTIYPFKDDGTYLTGTSVSTTETALGNVSLAINEAKTELHAAWSSKNSTYPNSFNISYAKGTINSDGTVTWGAVEQVTKVTDESMLFITPSVVFDKDGNVIIICAYNGSGLGGIVAFSKKPMTNVANGIWGWNYSTILQNAYSQSSPSAIYVPQSINGLANGRIWVAWQAKDATDTSVSNIRVSYSDDGGTTWSAMQKLTSGNTYNMYYPSITANKENEISILYTSNASAYGLNKIKNINNSWQSATIVNSGFNASYPSSLYDPTFDFAEPLFIYKNVQTSSVNFYGSWSAEAISPPVGERGKILNRQNLLTYNITSNSTIGTVTEKINGVVVGTKTLTSGQNTTVNITQAQWDAIPYGKYRNNSAGRNTIEIVTSNNTFTYTFEKWFDNTLDVISVTKAVKDSKDYYLPSAKKILSDAINSKGGSTTPTDSIESMASQVASGSGKRYKEGVAISSNSNATFVDYLGQNASLPYIEIDFSSIGFSPSIIFIKKTDKTYGAIISWAPLDFYEGTGIRANYSMGGTPYRVPKQEGITKFPVNRLSSSYEWVAYE